MAKKEKTRDLRSFIKGTVIQIIILVLLLASFVGGCVFRGFLPSETVSSPETEEDVKEQVRWTCSMHPAVDREKPGLCPICQMPLVPKESGGDREIPQFVTSKAAVELMKLQTSPVERRFATAKVRLVGKVDFDETRLSNISAWVPGRLDRLYVDYTGINVVKGDHMVYLYSPELLAAQDELKRAVQRVKGLNAQSSELLRKTAEANLEATRSKLKRWGLNNSQISQAEKTGTLSDHITIYAPMGGTVIEKLANEGQYVNIGTRIYTIADLSQVWVKLDAYESDLAWLRYGQKVTFTTEAYPGESFEGKIAFIEPVLNPKTRTVKIRVNVPNHEGRLKPEMFVRAVVESTVGQGGVITDDSLAGKWICRMHPSIISDEKGSCDICEMPLVPAEDVGYATSSNQGNGLKPLLVPATAPLITGRRAIVYVEVPGQERPTYDGREVVLGLRAGDYYIVKEGLQEGERVVTNGNFKIDSAMQLMAKPSMMSPQEGASITGHEQHMDPGGEDTASEAGFDVPGEFKQQLGDLFDAYSSLHGALVDDKEDDAKKAASATADALGRIDMALLKGDAHMAWMGHAKVLEREAGKLKAASSLAEFREAFSPLSDELREVIETFGIATDKPIYSVVCPMAFGSEAGWWLQTGMDVANPYLGQMMPKCGEVDETPVAVPDESAEANGGHAGGPSSHE